MCVRIHARWEEKDGKVGMPGSGVPWEMAWRGVNSFSGSSWDFGISCMGLGVGARSIDTAEGAMLECEALLRMMRERVDVV
jgi:hypothetical protein